MTIRTAIRYGNDLQPVHIPRANLLDEVGMQPVAAAPDAVAVIRAALDQPVASTRLEVLARGKRRVVVLVDDLTRPTPADVILPEVLGRLESGGLPRESISILVATGTHRPMTPPELAAKVGTEVVARYRVANHDYRLLDEIVHLGETPSGIPVTVNRQVAEADLVLAVGNIVPHRYCGWAGGAKMIQPGIGGEATTAGTHLMITKDPGARLGVVENQVRHEMESVAEQVNLGFIVNTILDRDGHIVEVVAGDFRAAFRRGVERARRVYSAPLRAQADVVVASAYPSDINFWQAGKALYSADVVVRDGGIIIIASPCYEGLGEHEEFVNLFQQDYRDIEQAIASGRVRDRIGAAAALAGSLIFARASIWLVSSHLTPTDAQRMGFRLFRTAQEAVDTALRAKGEAAQLTVLHEATEILPVLAA